MPRNVLQFQSIALILQQKTNVQARNICCKGNNKNDNYDNKIS